MTKRIGILTGGGDAPGLNAVIRGVTYPLIQAGFEVIGFHLGWKGILEQDYEVLTLERVNDIHRQGGTILGSSRTNVYKRENGVELVKQAYKETGLQALIAVGGDDTLGVASKLSDDGLNVIGVPKTIDNDVNATDYTFGFDTAINRVMETLDWLHTTTKAHRRVMVVEIMGRTAGWITLHGGIAGGAHFILIPEMDFDIDDFAKEVQIAYKKNNYLIIAVAEGADDPKLRAHIMHSAEKDEFGHAQLWSGIGIGEVLAKEIGDRTGLETRAVVLGHLQRGGNPSAFDRVLGTRFGVKAAELVKEKNWGKMVALKGSTIGTSPLADAITTLKHVTEERYNDASIFFG
ncbi:6-phosphofructokinase [Candidatus Calescamantes bacterium]|nr:6-phosphofructokinase [Candidatus Calescamantes bacterium]MCK5598774.1 6-phosphofructokinase [bacterium]